jgi:protein AroM
MIRIAAVTIGQSPRTEITTPMRKILEEGVSLVEYGLLDDATEERLSHLSKTAECPREAVVYVTRLRDGRSVRMVKSDIVAMLRSTLGKIRDEGLSTALILCQGEYREAALPGMNLLHPMKLVRGIVDAFLPAGRLGVIVPVREQEALKKTEWEREGRELLITTGSPYGDPVFLDEAAESLRGRIDAVVLDCLGFTVAMRRRVARIVSRPVFLPGTVVASVLREAYGTDEGD